MAARSLSEMPKSFDLPCVARTTSSPSVEASSLRGEAPGSVELGSPTTAYRSSSTEVTAWVVERLRSHHSLSEMPWPLV